MVHIQISETIESPKINALIKSANLEAAVRHTLAVAQMETDVDVTILLANDGQIQALNRQFRSVDAPTDVLAFPAGDIDPDSLALYLGDVIISYPQAEKQAVQAGHSLEAEIQLLVVHGVLHLLGYDHGEKEEKEHMWAAQAAALARLGAPPIDFEGKSS